MDLIWIIYFVDTFCGGFIQFACGLFTTIFIASFGIVLFYYKCAEENDEITRAYKFLTSKSVVCIMLIVGSIGVLIPSKETSYKMLAVHGVTELSTNEKVQQLSDKSVQVLEKVMDEYLNKDKNTN